MNEELICPVCGMNELLSEAERIDQMCLECIAGDMNIESLGEQDFDEMAWVAMDNENEEF